MPRRPYAALANGAESEMPTWGSDRSKIRVWTQSHHSHGIAAWNYPDSRENRPAAFVWGHPRIASDTEFGEQTRVENIDRAELPGRICRLFESHGTESFALLEGNFSLVLTDPRAGASYLVVDKFGCDDIYIRPDKDCFAFASHPASLLGADLRFDAVPIAFFLAHEGFIPAPFTVFEGIKTVGRAHFLQARHTKSGIIVDFKRYWRVSRSYELRTNNEAIERLLPLLESAVEVRETPATGLLLSGGTDSSLLLNIAARHPDQQVIAMTGTVKGFAAGEQEIARARELANDLHVPHDSLVIDPDDETLPNEWALLSDSWMAGSRVMLPVFHRLARRARNLLGENCSVLTGQMADTLADNNYTFPSLGYAFRRAFYSPWFLSLMPVVRALAPARNAFPGKALSRAARACFGPRIAEMVRCVLSGVKDRREFYEGRVFGYGEMPGRSREYFPSLTENGFECVANWYSSEFVVPVISRIQPSTFYRDMFELSLDMVMLHLDTRLVLHAFRLEQCRAELPFLDACVVNFFASLPYSARSIYRQPKNVIRVQSRRQTLTRPTVHTSKRGAAEKAGGKYADELLFRGALGAHFRDLLAEPTALHQVTRIFEHVDEGYCFEQIRLFRGGSSEVNVKFIARLAALEAWNRSIAARVSQASACATA